jgi:membrane-associated phospholipid phosphatase
MDFLYFLESIRNPFLNAFFSTVTHLGEETVFFLIGVIFFWCISKRDGYYLLSVGFLGTVLNQFLKLWFRIPRPWIRDPQFTIVEAARAEATGYSFPSGHTQSSVGVFGGIARCKSNLWLRIVCIAFCVLVPLSRLYLGVHTPLDVGVSIGLALLLIFVLYPIVYKTTEKENGIRILLAVITVMCVGLLLFVHLYRFPTDVDIVNLESGIKNAYKMLGCTIGMWLSFELDVHFIKFETKASLVAQILKLILGLIPALVIKSGLKAPLYALFGGSFLADGVRYFLLAAFIGSVWPLTFKFFSKLFAKENNL